jgi:hypothetical protein
MYVKFYEVAMLLVALSTANSVVPGPRYYGHQYRCLKNGMGVHKVIY